MHCLRRIIKLPISVDKAWDFFSDPKNLKVITPDNMGFNITSDFFKDKMYAGQVITYKKYNYKKVNFTHYIKDQVQ